MSRHVRNIIVKKSTGSRIIEQSRVRLLCVGLFFLLCFGSICVRMIEVAVLNNPKAMTIKISDAEAEKTDEVTISSMEPTMQRGNIVDRNGTLLATSLITASLFANPSEIKEPQEASLKLSKILKMDEKQLSKRLSSPKTFVWIKRNLTPKEQQAINSLGIPGLYFSPEERRVYPYGNLLAHLVGYVGVDNRGLGGIEQQFDSRLKDSSKNREAFALSVDVRLQAIMHEEIQRAVSEFQAIGGAGVIMDLQSGELLSMVSLPDFDPHKPMHSSAETRFNRVSLGSYEMGSTFKSFTMAMGLDYDVVNMHSRYDVSAPLRIATFNITDSHPLHRPLTIPEIYAYSSNI